MDVPGSDDELNNYFSHLVPESECPKEIYQHSSNSCCICLDDIKTNSTAVVNCAHLFCLECIVEWHRISQTCPLCKQPFSKVLLGVEADFSKYKVIDLEETAENSSVVNAFETISRKLHANNASKSIRDDLDIEKRRNIYFGEKCTPLIGCNKHTGFRKNIGPAFWKTNVKQLERADPWIKREMHIISGAHIDSTLVTILHSYFLELLKVFHVQSVEGVDLLSKVFDRKIGERLSIEFSNFARSPYNMSTYDSAIPLVDVQNYN